MSADSRMMTQQQVVRWAASELRAVFSRESAAPVAAIGMLHRRRFIARALYAHKITRQLMEFQGYLPTTKKDSK